MKRAVYVIWCLLALQVMTGCKKPQVAEPLSGWPVTVGQIVLSQPPKTCVTLSAPLTETVFCLGYSGRLVGVSDDSASPSAAASRRHCGSALFPDIQTIISLDVQLVITPVPLPQKDDSALRQAGVAVLVVPYSEKLDNVFDGYRQIVRAFEGEDAAQIRDEQLRLYGCRMIESALSSVKKSQPETDPKFDAIWLRYLPLRMATGDTLQGRWLSQMGFNNQASDFTDWNYPIESEPDLNPDIIIYDLSLDPEQIREHEYYMRTKAVKNSSLFAIDCSPLDGQTPYMFRHLWESMSSTFPDGFGTLPEDITVDMPPVPETQKSGFGERVMRRLKSFLG